MIYSVVAMTGLLLIASLAVDYGRVQLAKTEMQCAVDAASRAATAYLPSDAAGARAAAISVAGQHTVAGQALVLQSSDVVFGKWDAATKTLNTASPTPDAVQITAHRTVSRGTPITLSLTRAAGLGNFNLTVTGTAMSNGSPASYGILAASTCSITGTALTGTYNSTTDAFTTGSSSHDGSVACNGTWTLSGSIGGVVYYNTASAPSGGSYFEAKTKMTVAATIPATPTLGSYATSNDNPDIGLPTSGATVSLSTSGTTYVPGGVYVLSSGSFSSSTVIQFTGPATIYMTGNLSVTGSAQLRAYQDLPSNLNIKFTGSSTMTLGNSARVYAVVTAPAASYVGSGTTRLIGSIVANSINLSGSGTIYYDNQLGPSGGTGGTAGSTVVK